MNKKYKFLKTENILGKKKRLYKKKGSQKIYCKHKNRMINVIKYKKIKQMKKGGGFLDSLEKAVNSRNSRIKKNKPRRRKSPISKTKNTFKDMIQINSNLFKIKKNLR